MNGTGGPAGSAWMSILGATLATGSDTLLSRTDRAAAACAGEKDHAALGMPARQSRPELGARTAPAPVPWGARSRLKIFT
jgi:hypothetical protein